MCSVKKVFLEILKNSQENICARYSFLEVADLMPATLLKKNLWHAKFPRTTFTEDFRWLPLNHSNKSSTEIQEENSN